MRRCLYSLAFLFVIAGTADAQIQSGSISGTTTDEQAAVLPGVTLTLHGVDVTQTFATDATGQYRFLNLAPGPYTVTAEFQGFATIVREHVMVEVGKNIELALQMKIAALAETITVEGGSPLIDTKQTSTSTNITSDELEKIPTSRDPFAIMRSVPGVLVDRVNVGGNETGQQSNFASKGTRPQDAVWTLDGVAITDMTLTGSSPTYFNYDNFEAIHVATAGQAITQQAAGVTPATADHNKQISDYGFDLGGPLARDKAWFYGSYSIQDVRLVRRSGNLVDRTQVRNPNLKVNWQATRKDMVSFLYFDGFKIKDNRSPGTSGITFDAPTATFHQDNAYTDSPLHGLFKIADDRVLSPNMFLSAKYAYYNTGFLLTPEGGMNLSAGRDLTTARSYGSTVQSSNIRPQM